MHGFLFPRFPRSKCSRGATELTHEMGWDQLELAQHAVWIVLGSEVGRDNLARLPPSIRRLTSMQSGVWPSQVPACFSGRTSHKRHPGIAADIPLGEDHDAPAACQASETRRKRSTRFRYLSIPMGKVGYQVEGRPGMGSSPLLWAKGALTCTFVMVTLRETRLTPAWRAARAAVSLLSAHPTDRGPAANRIRTWTPFCTNTLSFVNDTWANPRTVAPESHYLYAP
jgi:hypothetical protein